jgi:hypothetical protein
MNWLRRMLGLTVWPEVTDDMRRSGITWAKTSTGDFIEVCDFCGGNCGQCGITGRVGNIPFNFERIVKQLSK